MSENIIKIDTGVVTKTFVTTDGKECEFAFNPFDICTPLFGELNLYALANGFPIWANLLFALVDEMDTAYAREQKLTNPRISKYTKKYHK